MAISQSVLSTYIDPRPGPAAGRYRCLTLKQPNQSAFRYGLLKLTGIILLAPLSFTFIKCSFNTGKTAYATAKVVDLKRVEPT